MSEIDAFNLTARLTLDTSDYDRALDNITNTELPNLDNEMDKVGETASGFGSKFATSMKVAGGAIAAVVGAVGTASAAFVKMTGDVASYGDNIDKMSQKMGISAQAYQEWDAVMQHSGTSMETLKASMRTLANAAQSNSDAFKQLGISQQELQSMSQEELFSRTIEALQNVEDTTTRTYLAGKTLGRGATELGALLNTSAEDTQKMKDRVHELGGVMSDEAVKAAAKYQDTLQDMTTAFDGLKRNMMSEFLPSVTTVMDGLTELFAGNSDKGLAIINDGINDFADNLTEMLPKVLEVGSKIVLSLGDAITQNLPALLDAGVNAVIMLANGIIENLPAIVDAGVKALVTLANGIKDNLPVLIPAVTSAVFEIVDILTEPETLTQLIDAGIQISVAVGEGIIEAIPQLIERIPIIVENIIEVLSNSLPIIGAAGAEILHAIADGIFGDIPIIGDVMHNVADVIEDGIFPVLQGVLEFLDGDFEAGLQHSGEGITGTVSNILGGIDSILGTNLQQWYDEVTAFWRDAGAKLYEVAHAQELAEMANSEKVVDLRTDIYYSYRDYAAAGDSAAEAFSKALEDNLKSPEQTALYNNYLKEYFSTENIEKWTESIQTSTAEAEKALHVPTEAIRQMSGQSAQALAELPQMVKDTANSVGLGFDELTDEAEETGEKVKEALTFDYKDFGDYAGLGVVEKLGQALTEEQEKASKIAAEVFSRDQEEINRLVKTQDISITQQIALWKKAQAQYVEGSKQYISINDKIIELENKQTNEVEKQSEEREKALKKYQDEVDKIYKSIEKIEEKYAETLKTRTSDIYNSYSLFEKVPDRIAVSGKDLMDNLENQVLSMEKFYGDIQKLAARGVSEGLVNEIQAMGVDAIDELDALLALSDEDLAKYDAMYKDKNTLAENVATQQLEGVRKETDEEIEKLYDDIEKLGDETAENLGLNFMEQFALGIKSGAGKFLEAFKEVFNYGSNALGIASSSSSALDFVSSGGYIRQGDYSQQEKQSSASNGNTSKVTVNINGIQYQNFTQLVNAVQEEIQRQMGREVNYGRA